MPFEITFADTICIPQPRIAIYTYAPQTNIVYVIHVCYAYTYVLHVTYIFLARFGSYMYERTNIPRSDKNFISQSRRAKSSDVCTRARTRNTCKEGGPWFRCRPFNNKKKIKGRKQDEKLLHAPIDVRDYSTRRSVDLLRYSLTVTDIYCSLTNATSIERNFAQRSDRCVKWHHTVIESVTDSFWFARSDIPTRIDKYAKKYGGHARTRTRHIICKFILSNAKLFFLL